jgi:hypothetical protein
MLHLTDVSVRSLAAPAKGQKDYFCKSLPGFGVRVSHGGTRSFFLFTGKENNRHRQTIGRFGIITLAQARAEAKRLLAEQTLGHGKLKSVTFSAALTTFEQQKYPELKARTVHDYKAIFRRHFSKKLGNVRLPPALHLDIDLVDVGLSLPSADHFERGEVSAETIQAPHEKRVPCPDCFETCLQLRPASALAASMFLVDRFAANAL